MLSNEGLGKEFWDEAVNLASYLVNRSSYRALNSKVPEEIWPGNLPIILTLEFFCHAYAKISNGKLKLKAVKCMFLGFSINTKGSKLWCLETNKTIVSRDLTFDESAIFHSKKGTVFI